MILEDTVNGCKTLLRVSALVLSPESFRRTRFARSKYVALIGTWLLKQSVNGIVKYINRFNNLNNERCLKYVVLFSKSITASIFSANYRYRYSSAA